MSYQPRKRGAYRGINGNKSSLNRQKGPYAGVNNGADAKIEPLEKRKPAYQRQPDLYFSHVWLDREIYSQVLMFIGWERKKRYSIKTAVRILLELGLKHYVIKQINLAIKELSDARREEREPIPPSDFTKWYWKKTRKGRLPNV